MFSLIVCNYNNQKYLPKCIRSVQKQSYKDWELIIVDDGSTDGSVEVCRFFASKDDRIKILSKENGGISSARLAGLGVASGEYVIFVDSDDWINKDMLSKCKDILHEHDVDIIIFGYTRVFDSWGLYKRKHVSHLTGYYSEESFKKECFVKAFYSNDPILPVFLWAKCFKKDMLDRVELHDAGVIMGEDRIWNLDIFAAARSFFFSDYCASFYRYGGITTTYYTRSLIDRKLFYQKSSLVASEIGLDGWSLPLSKLMVSLFYRHIRRGISSGISEQEMKTIISEELQDSVWKEIQGILSSEGGLIPVTNAIVNNDIDGIYELSKQELDTSSWKNKIKSIFRH